MVEQTAFGALLNRDFGGAATQFLRFLHLQPANPQLPITEPFANEILAFLILLAFFIVVRVSLSVERPGPVQQVAELIHDFVSSQAESVIGEGSQRYVMFVTCVLLFVLLCNLMGLAPFLRSPTAKETVTLGLALVCFLYYHYQGLREVGVTRYAKHFLGPIWWISWMMLPIEIISHFARLLSLSVRLYANMFAGGMVYVVFFSLVPFALPGLFLGMHLLDALIQTYIFMLLTMIYVAEVVAHER